MMHAEKRLDLSMPAGAGARVKRNRNILISIITCLELCGRQGTALRAHRDNSTFDGLDLGKFNAFVDFRSDSGDTVLREHMESCSSRASYMSKTTQNALLDSMGEVVLKSIIDDVKASWYYVILADKVTDTSGWEQLGVALCFARNGKPCELLVKFVSCEKVRGKDICTALLHTLQELGLDAGLCRGQSYGGAGNMSSAFSGCQAKFRQSSPHAPYYHYSSHQLNLALSKSSTLPEIYGMVCTLKSLGIFFKFSPKGNRALEQSNERVNEARKAVNKPQVTKQSLR